MCRSIKSAVIALAVAFAMLCAWKLTTSADMTVRYAKPGGVTTGTCGSWTNACDLRYALTTAISGTEIWAACGVYTPGVYMTSTFQLTSGVALYGGFAMTETNREQRNWQTNLTVLSGDIDGNDTTDPNGVVTDTNNIHGSNAYHVLNGSGTDATAILDGFTATAGKASGDGGGMAISSGSPTVQNVSFIGNAAAGSGGGLWNAGNPTLYHVLFKNNTANSTGGGLSASGNPWLTDVEFIGNRAVSGGGLYAWGSYNSVNLLRARFIGNRASSAAYYTSGGGMNVNMGSGSSLTLTQVVFSGNSSTWYGGGMNIGVGDVHLTNVLFYGNRSGSTGGGMTINQTAPDMTNVTVSGNWSSYGGGIYIHAGPLFPLTMVNSIVWGNDGQYGSVLNKQIYIDLGQVNAIYSDIQGGFAGEGNLNIDPQFTAPITATVAPTTTGDYHLQMTSPTIDAGNNYSVTVSTDLDGKLRRVDVPGVPDTGVGTPPIVDMGAYETQVPPDLGISVTDGKSYAVTGEPITYTLVVTNAGPDAVTGAVVTDTLPGTISSVTWTCVASGGSCSMPSGSGNLSTTVNLDGGGTIIITIGGWLSPGANGTLVCTAYVSHPSDPNPGNNSATDSDIVLYIKVYLPLVIR